MENTLKNEPRKASGVNPFVLAAGIYFLLDAIVLLTHALVMADVFESIAGETWVRVHLLTIGVGVQLILGTLPQLTAAQLGARLPSARVTWALWLLLNAGFSVLLIALPASLPGVAAIGALMIFAAITLLLIMLFKQVIAASVRVQDTVWLYIAGPIFFLVGILMAVSLLLNFPAPAGLAGIFEAHVHANVWGFLTPLAAGFLLNHLPQWTSGTLPFPKLVKPMAALLILGAAGLVAGPWLGIFPVIGAGMALYLLGTGLLLANILVTLFRVRAWTPGSVHIAIAYLWLIAPVLVAPILVLLTGKLPEGGVETAALSGLVLGWLLQMVLGIFFLHLNSQRSTNSKILGRWFSVLTLNSGVALIWLAAFVSAGSAAWSAAGFGLVFIGLVPALVDLFPRWFSGNRTGSSSQI